MSENASVPPAVNRMMKFILRSPLHGVVSKSVLLISFTGRKTGKTFTTPVSYSQDGDRVTIFTHATWWKNLRGGEPVTLRIRGSERQGLPEIVVEDQRAIAAALDAHLRTVPSDARWYKVTLDERGNPNAAEVARAAQSAVMLRMTLC